MFLAQGRAPLAALFALSSFAAAAAPVGPPIPLPVIGDAEVLDAAVDDTGRVTLMLARCVDFGDCRVELQQVDAAGVAAAPILHSMNRPGRAAIAVDADGDLAVVSDSNRHVTCYRADGTRIGTQRVVAEQARGVEIHDVAMDADGDFAVIWQEANDLTTYLGGFTRETIKMRRFDVSTCAATTAEKVVARSATAFSGSIPPELFDDARLAMSANGRLAATWVFSNGFGSYLRTQSWRANGTAIGGVQAVTSTRIYGSPAVGIANDGAFVVAYPPRIRDAGSIYAGSIVFRRFSPIGTPSAPESAGDVAPFDFSFGPKVGMDPAGDFVVGWTSINVGDRFDASLRRYDAGTQTLGAPFFVAPAQDSNVLAEILQQHDGSYAALYRAGTDSWFLQRYIP